MQDFTTTPVLRLETGRHMGLYQAIESSNGRFLVSGSLDKTVRIWDLQTERLLSTIHLPLGIGKEGEIATIAISNDASLIAAAGYVGYDFDSSSSIYVVDVGTGTVISRLQGIDWPFINGVLISPDGTKVAAMAGVEQSSEEVLVFDIATGQRLLRKRPGGLLNTDMFMWFSFDRHNNLLTSEFEMGIGDVIARRGAMRISRFNAPNYSLSESRKVHEMGMLCLVKNRSEVGITIDESSTRVFPTTQLSNSREEKGNLCTEKQQLEYLLSNTPRLGDFRFDNANVVRKPMPVGTTTVMFAGDTIATSLFDSYTGDAHDFEAKMAFYKQNFQQITQLAAIPELFTSSDGKIVEIRRSNLYAPDFSRFVGLSEARMYQHNNDQKAEKKSDGHKVVRVSLNEHTLELDPGTVSSGLIGFSQSGHDTVVHKRNPCDTFRNSITALMIDQLNQFGQETSDHKFCFYSWGRAVGLASASHSQLVGASPLWRTTTSAPLFGINMTPDGRYVVAVLGDGSVRWLRSSDGKEIQGMYIDPVTAEWVVWTDRGYYDASPHGDELVGWHINRGRDQVADFFSAQQFERVFYRPDFVKSYFDNVGDMLKVEADMQSDFPGIIRIKDVAPPRVRFTSPSLSGDTESSSFQVKFEADSLGLPMQNYSVYVNSIPVVPISERMLSTDEGMNFERELVIPLFDDVNEIRVEVGNGTSMGVARTQVTNSGNLAKEKGDLYVLSIGVSIFADMESANLEYAAKDADVLGRFFAHSAVNDFNTVRARILSDNATVKPTKANILEALDFIKQAKANDTVVLFLASHGMSDHAGNYYFMPADGQRTDVEALIRGDGNVPSLVGWQSFFDAIRETAGKRILIVDTCQAQNIDGTMDFHALAKRSASASFAIFAASKGTEASQEYRQGKHGLFTYALLEGLNGKGDRDGDGNVTLDELFHFSSRYVMDNREIRSLPQTPQLQSPDILRDMVLSTTQGARR